MGNRAIEIVVTNRQRGLLEKWMRNKADVPYRLIERCHIVLMSADGVPNVEQGRRLGAHQQRARRWRRRWLEAQDRLTAAEKKGATDKDLGKLVLELLSDRPRAGVPPTFSAEQLTKIIAIACEPPEESGRPVTHWTPRELADEVIKRGVVETISPRHIDRFLKVRISGRTRRSTG